MTSLPNPVVDRLTRHIQVVGYRLHGHTVGNKIRYRSNPFVFDRFVTIAPPTPGHVEAPRLLPRESHS